MTKQKFTTIIQKYFNDTKIYIKKSFNQFTIETSPEKPNQGSEKVDECYLTADTCHDTDTATPDDTGRSQDNVDCGDAPKGKQVDQFTAVVF